MMDDADVGRLTSAESSLSITVELVFIVRSRFSSSASLPSCRQDKRRC
jgi:hypothetical protein